MAKHKLEDGREVELPEVGDRYREVGPAVREARVVAVDEDFITFKYLGESSEPVRVRADVFLKPGVFVPYDPRG